MAKKRGRGRPKGSKNKVKKVAGVVQDVVEKVEKDDVEKDDDIGEIDDDEKDVENEEGENEKE